ncbi:MAG: arylformamidase [Parvularculaceae bacterium]
MSRLIDISPALSAASPAFPGDTPFTATPTWALGGACPVNVSKFETTTHIGAHADAPLHYDAKGAAIDEVPLAPYIGPCTVVHVMGDGPVTADALDTATAGRTNPRLLIRTYAVHPGDRWDDAFAAIAPDAIDWLADRGGVLIGVDTPSLDPAQSKTMDAHRRVFARGLRILEGLFLDHVAPGAYELIAPPLKLKGLDAAPVRAVLRTRS